MKNNIRSNFDMLRAYEAQLWRLGALAERYFAEDPNTSLLKLSQLSELLAQSLAARTGLYTNPEESHYELIRRLQGEGALPKEVRQVFDQIRINGNAANHALQGDHAAALSTLKLCWQLCLWFHRTFKDAAYRSGPFVPPQAPADESAELRVELAQLRQAVATFQSQQEQVSSELQSTKTQLSSLSEERGIWEQLATESDKDKALLAEQLKGLQAAAVAAPTAQFNNFLRSAATAATQVQLDEGETRRIIDAQLRQAGWEADTPSLRYSKGTRVTCSGIVDADHHDADDVAYLEKLGIAVLTVSEIENVILLPSISRAIAESEGYEGEALEASLAALKNDIFDTLNSSAAIDNVVARYCRRRIDRTLKKIDLSGAANVSDITAEYARQTAGLNVAEIAAYATDRITSALREHDLPALLANYDNKGLMALAAKHLKKSRLQDFESWLTRVLRSDKAPALVLEIRKVLPEIVAL